MKLDFSEDHPPRGVVDLPPSKSIANRLLIMAALADETGLDLGEKVPEDIAIMKKLLSKPQKGYDVKMAGTVARFLTAFLTLKKGEHFIAGDLRMLERPIGPLVDALRELGAEVDYFDREGHLPVRIVGGKLTGGKIQMAGNVSSQFISAVLMIGPYLERGLELELIEPIVSEPYITMTIELMILSGASVIRRGNTVLVEQGNYTRFPKSVEGDWSAAGYFYELLALSRGGEIVLRQLSPKSLQGDALCAELYSSFGVETVYRDGSAFISYNSKLASADFLEIDCTGTPDLVQTIACTCAGLKRPALITGVKNLRIKETDRLAALKSELTKLGVKVEVGDDHIALTEFGPVKNKKIHTFNDHRMAMAFAPLAVCVPGIKIQNKEVVAKSFPEFWDELHNLKLASREE